MNAVKTRPGEAATDAAQLPKVSVVEGWTLHEYGTVGSTNLMAAGLDAGNAVRADRQTAGRGRFHRGWVSDKGGLWLSAVVPCESQSHTGRALPLVAGLAVCEALHALGIRTLRLRWPNDVLVEDRKLAGLLVDQFVPGRAVIGIGLNVTNRPELLDAALKGHTARLADLVPTHPTVHELAVLLLRNLRRAMKEIEAGKFPELLSRLNELWGRPRRVELDLDGELRQGVFQGVDGHGRLILQGAPQGVYEPWQVRHLKEIS